MKRGSEKAGGPQSVFQKQAGTKQKIIKLESESKINPRQSVRKATLKIHGNKQVSSNTIEVPEQVNKYKKVHHKQQEKLKEGTGSHSIKLQEGDKRNQSRSKLTFKDQTVQEQAGSKFSVDGNQEEEGFKMPGLIRSNINIMNELEQHQSKQNVSIQFKLKKKSELIIEPENQVSPSLKHQVEDHSHDGTFRIEEEQNQININESYHKSASKQAFEKFNNFNEGSYDIQSQSELEEDEEMEEIRYINQEENGSIIEEVSDESSHSSASKSEGESNKAEEEYLEKFVYNAYEDPYFIEVTICHDFKWLIHETWYYTDKFQLLYLRKLIFFTISLLNVICYKIVNSWVFDAYEILLTFSNIILLLTATTEDHNKEVLSYQYIFLSLYFIDVFIQLLGKGVKVYINDMWNLYDFIILIIYAIYIFKRDLIPLDVSTFRIIRIPFYLGRLNMNLKIMLTSLQSSFKYIVENIAVLILFSALLSLIAMNLFQGVLKNRCMIAETGIVNPAHNYEESICGYTKCHEEGEICAKYISNIEFPTSYDNFYFSYTQIIRITLINDWTITMYMLMKQFHPIVCLYYILIIFILDKFCFQLVIAVLKTYYHRTTEYYHENPMIPDFIEDQVRMNLRALKNLSLWNQLQQGGMLYKRNPLILGNDVAIDDSFSSGSLNDLMTRQNVNKDGQEKKGEVTKLLSARQMNEMGLYKLQMKEKFELQTWIWKILFPKQYLQEYMIHQIDKREELFIQYYDLELFYRFKTCDFLSMRLNVVDKPYKSESQNDVILEKKKIVCFNYDRLEMKYSIDQILTHLEEQKIDKKKFNLPIIRKDVRIAQYMEQNNEDSGSQTSRYHKEMIEEYQLELSSISRRKPPKEKTILRQKFFQNNQKMTLDQQIQRAREQNLSKLDVVGQINNQILILDGKEYTFDDVNQLFQSKDDESSRKEIRDYHKLYELYRQVEITNQKISQKNWSGNDVILPQNQKYFKLFSLLTLLNLGWNFHHSKGLSYILGSIQFQMYIFITSPLTTILIDSYICINTMIISLENYVGTTVNFYTDVLLEIILMLELFMKGLTVKGYFRDKMNVLQGIINIISTTEPFLTLAFGHDEQWQDYLVIMRVCRAFFFFRVIKYNVFASNMISISYQVIPSFANLFILLFFLIINYAIFGMQLFRDKFPEEDLLTQTHYFDNVYRSWIAVFDISTGDDWYGVVILSTTYSYTYISLIYCISFVFIVIYIFFGLLLAIILDGFNEYMKHQLEDDEGDDVEIVVATESDDEQEKFKVEEYHRTTKEIISLNDVHQIKQKSLFQFTQLLESVVKPETEEKYKHEVTNKKTFFYFSKENKFRKLSYIITQSNAVQIYLMGFITWGSLINMAAITYYDYESQFDGLQTIQGICNLFIFVDGILIMVAMGSFGKQGYFKGVWITVDYIYVIFYFFKLVIHHPIIDGMMYLGYLRPLKVVSYHGMFQNERDAIYYSLKDIISIVYVILMFWLIFGIFGMTLFSHKFGYCDKITEMGVGKHHCEGEWKIYPFNFDTIFNSMVTLFAISTFDWLCSIWYIAINSNTEEFGPTRFKNEWPAYVFFVSFLLIGSIFLLGFLAGIIFVNFTQKKSQLINPHLTLEQGIYIFKFFFIKIELFLKISDTIMKETPDYSDPAKKGIRLMAKNLLNNKYYSSTIRLLQFANFIVLMTYEEDAQDSYLKVINYIHHGLSAFLLFDLIVKLLTYHIRRYFGDTWRKIEFFFVLNSIIDLSLDLQYNWFMDYARSSRDDPWFMYYRIYFVIRDLRLILIIQFFQKIRRLLNVISFNILTIFRILGLFVTFMVCYSYIGCQLYGQIKEGFTMNDQLNFKNIGYAMLTLFKVQTRNFWRIILTDSTSENPYCHEDHDNCGRSWTIAVIYYVSFVFISFYILMNLIVSQLVSEFERFYDTNSNVVEQYIESIDKFRNVWCKYTQEYKGKKMHTKYLAHFLLELGEPFGAQSGDNVWDAAKTASGFQLKADHYGCISFKCLLYECVKFRYKESIFKLSTPEGKRIMRLHDKKIRYRLYNLRDPTQRREVVDQYIGLDANFNILQEYLYLKMTFIAWIKFSRKFMEAAQNVENSAVFSEQDVISSDDEQEQVVRQVKKVRRRTPSAENLRRPTDVYILQYYEKELKFKLKLAILNRFLEQKKKDDVDYIFKPQSQESKQKQQKAAPVMKKKQQILKIDEKRKYQEQAQGQIQRNRYQYGYHDKVPVPKYQLQSFATSEDYVVQSKLDLPSGMDVVNRQRKSVKFKQQ